MSDDARKAAAKARLLAKFEQDWAQAERLAAEYPELFAIVPGALPGQREVPKAAPGSPAHEPEIFHSTVRVSDLIAAYKADADSPYRRLKYKGRNNYDALLRRIQQDLGSELVASLDARRLKRAHEDWSERGRLAMAHSLMTMLRALSSFGGTWLKSNECRELKLILSNMEFPLPPPRDVKLTTEHAIAIREQAHRLRRPSIALAQAFQFDCRFRQADVIGEWVPISEQTDPTDEHYEDKKWIRGLRWSSIDDDLRLRHITNKGQLPVDIDLKDAPMVMEELQALYCRPGEKLTRAKLPAAGPIVLFERTRRPYYDHQYRTEWRKMAHAAGVPKGVRNADSRAPARLDRLDPSRRHLRKKEIDSAL